MILQGQKLLHGGYRGFRDSGVEFRVLTPIRQDQIEQ